jgi:hypothetical protein
VNVILEMLASEDKSTINFETSIILWTASKYEQARSGKQTLKKKRTPKL